MPRQKQRTLDLRDRILQVAVAMVDSEGLSGLTTRKVAQKANTSTPAVYELFGDKAGLVRELFFEGFRLLHQRFSQIAESASPRADLEHVIRDFRVFMRENQALSEVMFSRPFADFDPGPTELSAGAAVRRFIVKKVRRCIEAGMISGDENDIALVLISLTQGLAATERAGRLGSTETSIDRRWDLALRAVLDGLNPK